LIPRLDPCTQSELRQLLGRRPALRIDTTSSHGLDERSTKVPGVVGIQHAVGGHDGAHHVAEVDIDDR
jgi:hypothetical protein